MHPHGTHSEGFGLVGLGELGQVVLGESLRLSLDDPNIPQMGRAITVDTPLETPEVARMVEQLVSGFQESVTVVSGVISGEIRVLNHGSQGIRFVDVRLASSSADGPHWQRDIGIVVDTLEDDPAVAMHHADKGARRIVMARPDVVSRDHLATHISSERAGGRVTDKAICVVANPLVDRVAQSLVGLEHLRTGRFSPRLVGVSLPENEGPQGTTSIRASLAGLRHLTPNLTRGLNGELDGVDAELPVSASVPVALQLRFRVPPTLQDEARNILGRSYSNGAPARVVYRDAKVGPNMEVHGSLHLDTSVQSRGAEVIRVMEKIRSHLRTAGR